MSRIGFLNTYIDSLTAQEAVDVIDAFVRERTPRYVVTPNTDIIVKMSKDDELLDVCSNADLILTDGEVVVKLSKLLGNPIKERIAMTDFVWDVLDMATDKGYGIFFLGGKEDVLSKGVDRIRTKYPKLKVSGVYSPPLGFEKNEKELFITNEKIKNSGADLLIVFLGCPKQEKFIAANKNIYNVPVSITMGGCIDFIGNGNIKRAPVWMQKVGLEWFFRFMQEPERLFKRYFLDDMQIFPMVIKYRIRYLFNK